MNEAKDAGTEQQHAIVRRHEALLADYLCWLQSHRSLAAYTLRNYQSDVAAYLRYLGDGEVPEATAADRATTRGYLSHLLEQGIAVGSIRRKVSALRSFYAFLVRDGLAPANPLGDSRAASRVRGPKKDRLLPSFLDNDEVTHLIMAADDGRPTALRDRAILEVLYATGVRVSELVNLDLDGVDLHERTLRVRGKGDKERLVVMGRPARQALLRYLSDGRPSLVTKPDERALFLSGRGERRGERLSVRAVQLLVQRYALKAGIDQRVYPHLLRHTFATHLTDNNADIRVVQQLMGHAKADTTQIYAHVTAAQQRRVYDAAFYNQLRPRKEEEEEE